MQNIKVCPKCHQTSTKSISFCPYDGTALVEMQPVKDQQNAQQTSNQPQIGHIPTTNNLKKKINNVLYVILAFLLVAACCLFTNSKKQVSEDSNNAANNQTQLQTQLAHNDAEKFKAQSSAEHLSEAKFYSVKGASKEWLRTARQHLEAIPPSAKEYQEAQSILKEVEKAERAEIVKENTDKSPIVVISSSWRRGAFGVAGIWTVTFENQSDKPVGDIKYRTRYYSETGNDLGGTGGLFTEGNVQKIIPPHQKRTIKINDGFIHNEAASGTFEVTGSRFIQ